jgi:hypothetical protein
MNNPGLSSSQRVRVIFFLIVFVAALWAVFLIRQHEFFQFTIMIALIAGLNPVFVFIDVKNSQRLRGWIFFYLIALVGMLWATFLVVQGVLLLASLAIFFVVSGTTLYLLVKEDTELLGEGTPT